MSSARAFNYHEASDTIPLVLIEPPPPVEIDGLANARSTIRWSFVVLTVFIIWCNLDLYVLVQDWVPSRYQIVAAKSGYPDLIVWLSLVSAVMTAPFLICQLFFARCRFRKRLQQMSVGGLYLAALLWGAMLFTSRNLDMSMFWWSVIRSASLNISFAVILAVSLNNEQLLKLLSR